MQKSQFVRKYPFIPNEMSALLRERERDREKGEINIHIAYLTFFLWEHDTEADKGIMVIISVKEHLHILAYEISHYFPNLSDSPNALARIPFIVKVEDIPETEQEEFIEFINRNAVRTGSF